MAIPALRAALLDRYPWVGDADLGPRAVEAGECDICVAEARLVAPCGPPPAEARGRVGPDWAVGRRCLVAFGDDLWCDGHLEDARRIRAWGTALPPEADDVARLWWLSTGEVRLDAALLQRAATLGLPAGGFRPGTGPPGRGVNPEDAGGR